MVIPPDRQRAIRDQLAAHLQKAAALAFELGDALLSRQLHQQAEAQRALAAGPGYPPADPRYEHKDERQG